MLTPARAETLLGLPVTGSRWQTVITVTPEKAKIILDGQPRQRPLNTANLTKLKNDIQSGNWRRTHQGIAFDEDGYLSDGQHRLRACYETQTPIEVMAHFNEPRDMFHVYDGGVVRGMGVHLYLGGMTSNPSLAKFTAPAARFIWAYDQGHNPVHAATRGGWTFDTARAVLAAHPRLPALVEGIWGRRIPGMPTSVVAALLTLMEEGDAERGAIFAHQLLTGENLRIGDPVHVLRETASRARFTPTEIAYRIARAWNAFYEGRPLLRLYGSKTANAQKARTMDAFPEIAGYRRPAAQVSA